MSLWRHPPDIGYVRVVAARERAAVLKYFREEKEKKAMADDCTHPRGEGCAFCPDCGGKRDVGSALLGYLRRLDVERERNERINPMANTYTVHVKSLGEWAAWVERKIAEEKK